MIGSLAVISVLAGTALSQQPTQPTTHWATTSPEFAVQSVSVDGAWALIDNVPASRTAGEAWVRPNMFNAAVLEAGATDGITLSNTYLLETEYGWSGICCEPNPRFFDKLKGNRNCIAERISFS